VSSDGRGVSLIIPAYNEAGRVAEVVRVASASGVFAEILVVDDGSSDSTAEDAAAAGARVLKHERNLGKPQAMKTGLDATSGELVCFLDADLLSFDALHIELLVAPVRDGQCSAALAVFRGGRGATTLAQTIAPLISGQRCLERLLLDGFADWNTGYGIETALNSYLKKLGIDQRLVYWDGASHRMKEEKRGLARGFLDRLKMYWQILAAWVKSKLRR
jgi:glycosyltransferase involved in cell wall biosynthesis